MARIDQVEREKLGARQQQLYDEIMRTRPRGKLSGPFSVWIHRPDIAEPANGLANCFRVNPKLDKRLIELIGAGMITGASNRNWSSCRVDVKLGDGIDPIRRALLTDPQTSGGLLAACEANAVEQVLGVFYEEGTGRASRPH